MVKKDLITALRPAGFVVAGLACLCLLACGQGVYGANMSLNGICYATISIEDQNGVTDVFDYVPENLDVRVMSIDIGTGSFIDYTDLTQPHDTYRDINGVGYYRVQAKPDLTFTQGVKEGFSTNEQIHLFIYGERVFETYWNNPPPDFVVFYFTEGTSDTGPSTAHFTNTPPAYSLDVTSIPLPGGAIQVEWLLSASGDADKYLLFYDNGTGTLDYGWQKEIATISHPTNSVLISRNQGLVDGTTYKFAIRVQDALGSREYTSNFIYDSAAADSTPPTVAITVPAEGATLSGITVEIEGTVQDDQFKIYRVEYGEGNAPTAWFPIKVLSFEAAAEKTNERLAKWNITETREDSDGLYAIRVTAEDLAGNATTTQISVIIDNDVNFITQPLRYEIIGGNSVQIIGTATDPEFSYYKVYYGKGESPSTWHAIPVGDGSSGAVQGTSPVTDDLLATWDTRGFEGLHTIRLDITKTTGVTVGREATKVTVENTRPGLDITSPSEDINWKYTEINVTGRTQIDNMVTVESPLTTSPLDAVIGNDGTFTIYNVPLQAGANTITATVYGPATNYSGGNPSSQSWALIRTVTVDEIAPTLTLTAPTDNSIVRQGAVTVAGTSEPGATLTVNDTVVEIETNGSFTHLAVIKLGARTITVVATDLAGNSTTETRKVTFDPDVTDYNAPVIELVSPRPQATVTTATPVISFRVGDDFAGVDSNSLKVIIDGTDFIPQISVLDDLTMEGTYTVIVNLSEGEHTLKLTAADTLGNQAQPVETTFTVATKAPETMLWLDWNENDSDTVTLHLLSKLAIDPSDYLLNIYTEEFDTAISATSIKFPPDAPFSKQDLDQFIADNEWEGVRDYPWGEYYTTTFTLNNEILNRKILLQLYDNSTLLDSAVLGTVLVYDDRLQTFTTDDGTTLVFQENSFHDQSTGNDITTDLSFFSWTEERQNDRTEELKTAARASQGLVKIAKGYEMQFAGLPVGVTAVTLTPEVAVRLPYTKNQSGTVTALDGVTEVNSNQLGVFIWNDTTNRYDFGGSNLLTVSTDSGTVTLAEGTFDKLGTFELLADTVNPTITLFPDPGETLDSGEELHFDVSEKGCPINTQSILLQVNNLNSIHFYKTIDDMNGEIFYVPAGPHSGATVTITLTVPDSCSNSAQFSRSFLLREAFGIRYTLPYPNPVRTNNITIRYVLTQEADDVIIEIYDLNGDLMEELNGGTAATFNEVVWNLTDYGGTPVPNGSYIYRVMATRLQETFKTTGKLSILR